MDDSEFFYVGVKHVKGQIAGHAWSGSEVPFKDQSIDSAPSAQQDVAVPVAHAETFSQVFAAFVSSMESFRRFMKLAVYATPHFARVIAEKEISEFVEEHGSKRPDLAAEEWKVYQLPTKLYREFLYRNDKAMAAMEGASFLPQMMLIGLISAYDAFLSSLLRVVISKHPEIVFNTKKELKYSDLLKFNSIEEAKISVVDKEIEDVLRKSHHEQFEWMQDRLSVRLKDGLAIWAEFVEICERRNLLTHTGGIVSQQYIRVCRENKVSASDDIIGTRLVVSNAYFEKAIEVIYEIGLKLTYVFWRKFDADDTENADTSYNETCMKLIAEREYRLSESLLSFSHKVPRLKDVTRRMMVVNLANSLRLQSKAKDSTKMLEGEDWSAANDEFLVCVAAVKGDVPALITAMARAGTQIAADSYRTWPVFRGLRTDDQFKRKFEEIFGEPLALFPPKKVARVIEETDPQENLSAIPNGTTH